MEDRKAVNKLLTLTNRGLRTLIQQIKADVIRISDIFWRGFIRWDNSDQHREGPLVDGPCEGQDGFNGKQKYQSMGSRDLEI